MKQPLSIDWMTAHQDQQLSEAIERDEARLRNFIRRRVADPRDVEDILQEVFYELIEAYRMMKPIEQVGAWMFRVARNRIIDLFRRKKPQISTSDPVGVSDEGQEVLWEDLLPSPDAGPEAAYARGVLLEELEDAIEELPEEQRYVFIAHELEGRSFKELAAETGVSMNTLLARKRYAVRHLRRRLQAVYNEFSEK
jgi:RNA polymerase sigma factor (sigma-70 family)